MYVCSCRAVTDRAITHEVSQGAQTIDDLAARCGAGAECGGCWPALETLLRQSDRTLAAAGAR